MLVLVDEDAVPPAEPPAEEVQLLAKLRVVVPPGVAGERPLLGGGRGPVGVVTERRRHHSPGALEEALGMTGDLGLGHGEAHAGEQAAFPPFADVALRLLVGADRRRPDDVDPELPGRALELPLRHEAEGSSRNRPVRMAA
jgi:hypothetical protein